jgi:hypothetical protein
MKKWIALAVVCGAMVVPSISFAAEPARDRAAEASDVAAALGLGGPEVRVLSESEAEAIRGTGGCFNSCSLLNLNLNAKVKANVNVLGAVKVKANVKAGIRL